MSGSDSIASRFDRRASSYDDSLLQQFLFIPVQQTALRLALQLRPQARRILDVGCGTGQLLRRARPCYPTAQLVGVDLARQMVTTAATVTPTELAIRYIHARAEQMPFIQDAFDLTFATLSFRHWTNPPAESLRSAASSIRVGCSSSPTSSPASHAAVRPFGGSTDPASPYQANSAASSPPIA